MVLKWFQNAFKFCFTVVVFFSSFVFFLTLVAINRPTLNTFPPDLTVVSVVLQALNEISEREVDLASPDDEMGGGSLLR